MSMVPKCKFRQHLGLVAAVSIALVSSVVWMAERNQATASGAKVLPFEDKDVLHEVLSAQAVAWNQGDIPTFMQAYWNSPDLSFSSGGATTHGWEATRKRYLDRYPDRATMGELTFSDLETKLLGDHAALTLGRWHLKRAEPIGGNFSLVWQKLGGRWVIVHDHTSVTPASK